HPPTRSPGAARGAGVTSPTIYVPVRLGGRGPLAIREVARRMARQQDPAPRAARLTALAAVAILAMVAAFAFGRVFQGRAPTLQLMAAALASVVLAAAFERRSLLLSTLASAVGLLWVIGIIVFPRSLWYG